MRSFLHQVTPLWLVRLASVLTICLLLSASTLASAQSQATLNGEIIDDFVTSASYYSFNCSSVVIREAAAVGPATGPYPGEAEVYFEVTFGPADANGLMAITSFTETFTITSGDTVITGTKTLGATASIATSFGVCKPDPSWTLDTGYMGEVYFESADVVYTATIQGPLGTTSDSGTATVVGGTPLPGGSRPFLQTFTSTPACDGDDEDSDDSDGDDDDDDCDDEEDDDQEAA